MPIRLRSATSSLGRIAVALEDMTSNFDGAITVPATFTGALATNLQEFTSSFVGQFEASASRVGTIATTLDNFTALFVEEVTTVPSAPTGVEVTLQLAASTTIDWSDNTETDLDHYDIYRSSVSASGPWSVLNTSPLTASTFTDTGLSTGVDYWYYVTAIDTSGDESPASAVVSRFTAITTGFFVDGSAGNDSWDGTSPTFVSGSVGPKATISAGINLCSTGDSLYLVNGQSYGFATYDLNWNSGSTPAQAGQLSGCYVSGGEAYPWTPASGTTRPAFIGRFRSTSHNFAIRGIEFNNTSWLLRGTNCGNFTFQYNEVNRSGTSTSDAMWFLGTAGSTGFRVTDNTLTWSNTINWAGGNDMLAFNAYQDYIEVARNVFTRAPHDCLSIAGSNYVVYENTFDNVDDAGSQGYRACSFSTERAVSGSADGGEPYGAGLVQNNAFFAANAPTSASPPEYTNPACKMQTKMGIFRLNTFNMNGVGNYSALPADVWQMQTCCTDDPSKAPLIANQRLYNNQVTVTGSSVRRWIRQNTTGTDGTSGTENTRTEQHDNHVFNNHFEGTLNSVDEAMFEFQGIAPAYRVGNTISQNKVEYNSFSDSRTSRFLQDATNGQRTLAQAESDWPGYVNNNSVGSAGGAGLGRALTTVATSAVSSTTLRVADPYVFYPLTTAPGVGWVLHSGDVIDVNGQTATVTAINHTTGDLTLDTAVTASSGDEVNLDGYVANYTGVAPTPAIYWDADFETGDMSDFDGFGSGGITVENNGEAYEGTYHGSRVLSNGSNNDWGEFHDYGTAGNLSSQIRNYYAQVRTSFDTFTGNWPSSSQKIFIFQFYDSTWNGGSFSNNNRKYQMILTVAGDNAGSRAGEYVVELLEWPNESGGGGTPTKTAFVYQNSTAYGPADSFGSWDSLRIRVDLDTNGSGSLGDGNGNGVLQVWLNNELIIDYSDVNFVDGNPDVGMGRLLLSSKATNSWVGSSTEQFWDEIQVANDASVLSAMPSASVPRAGAYVPNIRFEQSFRDGNDFPDYNFAGTHSGMNGSQWEASVVTNGSPDGAGDSVRLVALQGQEQMNMGWFFGISPAGGWSNGDIITYRFRIKFESTYRWNGGGSQQNKMINAFFQNDSERMILHNERPHTTSPGALGLDYESATNNGHFGGFSMKHGIAEPVTQAVAVTYDGGPSITPNPTVDYVAPINGWYSVQLQWKLETSQGANDGWFKMWINNTSYASPNSEVTGCRLTSPGGQMGFGEFWTDANGNTDCPWQACDLQVETSTAAEGGELRFRTDWT